MKKLFWDASPAVIIAKKAKDSQKNKQAEQSGISREQRDVKEAQEKADKQARKDRKKLSIDGCACHLQFSISTPDVEVVKYVTIRVMTLYFFGVR